mgnify:FL=1
MRRRARGVSEDDDDHVARDLELFVRMAFSLTLGETRPN